VNAVVAARRDDAWSPSAPRLVAARHRRRRSGVVISAMVVLVFGTLLALAAVQARLAEGQSTLDHLRSETAAKQAYLDRLRLRVAELTSPEHIVSRATALGMVQPDAVTYLRPDGNVVAEIETKGLTVADPGDVSSVVTGSGWPLVKRVNRTSP
jgi:cell division protein FtsL